MRKILYLLIAAALLSAAPLPAQPGVPRGDRRVKVMVDNDFGGDPDGEVHVKVVAPPLDDDRTVRGLLRHFHPLQPLRDLRVDADAAEAGLQRDDAAESLEEPAADAVVTVVQVAAAAVPFFPDARGAIVHHVQVAGIAPMLEKTVQPIHLFRPRGPLGDDGNAHQARGQMTVPKVRRTMFEGLDDGRAERFRDDARQQREDHVHLAAGGVDAVMVERFVDACTEGFIALPIRLRIGLLAQCKGNLLQLRIDLAEGAVGHEVDGGGISDINALRSRPIAKVPAPVIQVGPGLEQAVHRVGVDIVQPVLHYGIKALQRP